MGSVEPAATQADQTAEQLSLFDLGVDMKQLRSAQADLLTHQAARTTTAQYRSVWKTFVRWCTDAGRSPLPATEETVGLYLTDLLHTRKCRVTTATVHLAGIRASHRAQGFELKTNGGISKLLTGARRSRAGREAPKAKAALTVDQVKAMVAAIAGTDAHSARDRAVLVIGFASGMRRSELAALDLADIDFREPGVLIGIRKSKTDQNGHGRVIGLFAVTSKRSRSLCPVRALRAWLRVRGTAPGPLFPRLMSGYDLARPKRATGSIVASAVHRGCAAIGLNPAAYGAHSLRAGLVTTALAAGASELAIMQRTGHRQVSTLQRYVRPVSAFQFDPLARAL